MQTICFLFITAIIICCGGCFFDTIGARWKVENKVNVTWGDVENFVEQFVGYLRANKIKPSGVYGIPRGGLILATLLSYRLDIPLLTAPCTHCVVVDDIADSGRTLLHFTDNDTQFNKYLIATMYYHQRSLVKPNFYLFEKTDEWINFPWEKSLGDF